MSIWYDLPRGQFFDEEDRYVNPATVAEKLVQAEAALAERDKMLRLALDDLSESLLNAIIADLKARAETKETDDEEG